MKDNNVRETLKTIALAAIIAGVISFVAGVHYAENQTDKTQAAVREALHALPAAPAPSKP